MFLTARAILGYIKVSEGVSLLPGMMTHLLLKKYKRHWTQYNLSSYFALQTLL